MHNPHDSQERYVRLRATRYCHDCDRFHSIGTYMQFSPIGHAWFCVDCHSEISSNHPGGSPLGRRFISYAEHISLDPTPWCVTIMSYPNHSERENEMPANVSSMAYAGEVPWHGEGVYVGDKDLPVYDMLGLANIDWEVEKVALQMHNQAGELIDTNRVAIRKVGTDRVFGYPTNDYELFQNRQAADVLEVVVGGGATAHTLGSLNEEEVIWFLAALDGQINLKRKDGTPDVVKTFLLISTGHTGSRALRIALTTIRVVCWNTLSAALAHNANLYTISHSATIEDRAQIAGKVLVNSAGYFTEFEQVAQELIERDMSQKEFGQFTQAVLLSTMVERQALKAGFGSAELLEQIVEKTAKMGTYQKTYHERRVDFLYELFAHGAGNSGESRWDALNAVTQYTDHEKSGYAKDESKNHSARLNDAWFGRSAELKQVAVELLTADAAQN